MISATQDSGELRNLQSLQSRFQAAVVTPCSETGGSSQLEFEIVDTSHFSATDRLAVYQNAYLGRLIEVLENEFPELRKLVGDEAFAQFAADYLREHPSRSYTLGNLSQQFVGFLRRTRPAREDIPSKPDLLDLVVDLANLEFAINQAFDGPGIETDRARGAVDESLPDSDGALQINPSLRLLECLFPVHLFYARRKSSMVCPELEPSPSWIVVSRRDYVVRYRAVHKKQYQFLKLLQRRVAFADVLAATFDDASQTFDETQEMVFETMKLFAEEQWLAVSE